MVKTGTQRTTEWRARVKVKRLRDEAAFDQVLGAMVVEPVKTPEGWTVRITLPKSVPEYAVFEGLADSMQMTPVELFTRLLAGMQRRDAK